MIVVFGSLNIDLTVPVKHLPTPGETVLGANYEIVAGGKGANQALMAARAGAEVAMIGKVGNDGFADVALHELQASGVDLSSVGRDQGRTGCAMIAVDAEGRNLIIVASGANALALEHQVPDALLASGNIVLLQMEVPAAQNWALVARAAARGAKVILNAAPAGPIPGIAIADLDWLIVNENEATSVAQGLNLGSLTPRETAKAIAKAVNITCIVTLGAEGAMAATGDATWQVGALPITPVDTTGAGDAFVGAFAAAVAANVELPEALRFASVAGGLACLKRGAQPSFPTKSEIESRLREGPEVKALDSQ